MKSTFTSVCGLVAAAVAAPAPASSSTPSASCIDVAQKAPAGAHQPLENFMSYSVEFSSFPDYAGNLSNPNTYSDNLLNSLAHYAGSKPRVRVGGATQDLSIFNASQTAATIQYFAASNPDMPANETFGPAFFESYRTWPGVLFSHGFNLGANSAAARQALLDSVPYACHALQGRFNAWELGNEPDFYTSRIFGMIRPAATYDAAAYVAEWLNVSRQIKSAMQQPCPNLANNATYKFFAPSTAENKALSDPKLLTVPIFAADINADQDIGYISTHKYVAARGDLGVTLQGTLLNHTNSLVVIGQLVNISNSIQALTPKSLIPNAPFILGEGNSLARQGIGGVSNSFGAALWILDYGLGLVANGIGRWHMHQGTNYRYQAWQPIATSNTTLGTKAPYYGNVAVSAFLGDLTNEKTRPQVIDLGLPNSNESAYASYVKGKLAKIVVINMATYNATASNVGFVDSYARPVVTYTFSVPSEYNSATLLRLSANGSDAITGVTFDGYSYAQELGNGMPVRLNNVTSGEQIKIGRDNKAVVTVPLSSAVIIDFNLGRS